jgi:hypothetical protein
MMFGSTPFAAMGQGMARIVLRDRSEMDGSAKC